MIGYGSFQKQTYSPMREEFKGDHDPNHRHIVLPGDNEQIYSSQSMYNEKFI